MARSNLQFVCAQCGATTPKWQGQCPDCEAWNTLGEQAAANARGSLSGAARPLEIALLNELDYRSDSRMPTGLGELDRVLGGGLVPGSVTLIGGDPGIGKSTLLLQAAARLSGGAPVCYVTGEESLQQVGLRAERLGVADQPLRLLAETCVEDAIRQCEADPPRFVVIDSIQTMWSSETDSAPGSFSQVRDSAARWVRFAKQHGVAVLLIGHVTKEGAIAGPRILEHMVDTVLYFESDTGSRYRMLRSVKNRFGAANEIGVFAMTADGFKEVRNPSAIFLSRHAAPVVGSAVTVTLQGTRPLLLEVQALVDSNRGGPPRRVSVGVDGSRLAILLAVLHRHGGVAMYDHDVFLNVAGGVRVLETAADLPALLAAVSSMKGVPLPDRTVFFGEVGLTGEVRPVPYGEERQAEAFKHGFERAVVPLANVARVRREGLECVGVATLKEALAACFSG